MSCSKLDQNGEKEYPRDGVRKDKSGALLDPLRVSWCRSFEFRMLLADERLIEFYRHPFGSDAGEND